MKNEKDMPMWARLIRSTNRTLALSGRRGGPLLCSPARLVDFSCVHCGYFVWCRASLIGHLWLVATAYLVGYENAASNPAIRTPVATPASL